MTKNDKKNSKELNYVKKQIPPFIKLRYHSIAHKYST